MGKTIYIVSAVYGDLTEIPTFFSENKAESENKLIELMSKKPQQMFSLHQAIIDIDADLPIADGDKQLIKVENFQNVQYDPNYISEPTPEERLRADIDFLLAINGFVEEGGES